jgi:hypothetical protein
MVEPGHEKSSSNLRSWVIVILFSAGLVGWGVLNYKLVKDPDPSARQFQYGVLPSAPGESIYSTREAPPVQAQTPRQIVPLPEAQAANSAEKAQ